MVDALEVFTTDEHWNPCIFDRADPKNKGVAIRKCINLKGISLYFCPARDIETIEIDKSDYILKPSISTSLFHSGFNTSFD